MMKKLTRISRAKFENIAYISLNLVNMATYLMICVASILKAKEGSLADIIQCIYCTVISLLLILHEFSTPARAQIYFGFLSIHRGKGLLMWILGSLVMCKIAFNIIVTILTFTLGFAYFIMSLVSTLPPPNGFLVHWQNRKDFWAEGLDLPPPPPTVITTQAMMEYNQKSALLTMPHPSAWHPFSSHLTNTSTCFTTPVHSMDYSKFQHHFLPKDKKLVLY